MASRCTCLQMRYVDGQPVRVYLTNEGKHLHMKKPTSRNKVKTQQKLKHQKEIKKRLKKRRKKEKRQHERHLIKKKTSWLRRQAPNGLKGAVTGTLVFLFLEFVIWHQFESFLLYWLSFLLINMGTDAYLNKEVAWKSRRIIWWILSTMTFIGASILGKYADVLIASSFLAILTFFLSTHFVLRRSESDGYY